MSRLWSSGFESNSLTANVEFTTSFGTVSIQSGTVRSGTYALRINPTASSGGAVYQFKAAAVTGVFFFRTYFRIASAPGATTEILLLIGNTSAEVSLRLTTARKLQLGYTSSRTQLGSDSSVLNLNQWYRLEVKVDCSVTTASVLDAQIDGVSFASGTVDIAGDGTGLFKMEVCSNATTTTDLFFDDLAINDNSGSFQNSYPGAGSIIHLVPNAAGDKNTINGQVGGVAGSANNYTRVSEVTPDDGSSFNSSNILNEEDLFNVTDSGIGASDTVNVVSVGARFANNTADAATAIKYEIEKTSGGTITQSSAIIPNSTTWKTNATTAPNTHPITLYQDPDSSNWTQATLDSMQIGYVISTGGSNGIRTSTIWALVDYTPNVNTGNGINPIWIRSLR